MSKREWWHGRTPVAHMARGVIGCARRGWRAWKGRLRAAWPGRTELEAFRACVRLERKLEDYPYAVPVLERLMRLYRETGQERRRLDVMRRLRDEPELPRFPAPVLQLVSDVVPSYETLRERRYEQALELVRMTGCCSPELLVQRLGVGFHLAGELCALLLERGAARRGVSGLLRAVAR